MASVWSNVETRPRSYYRSLSPSPLLIYSLFYFRSSTPQQRDRRVDRQTRDRQTDSFQEAGVQPRHSLLSAPYVTQEASCVGNRGHDTDRKKLQLRDQTPTQETEGKLVIPVSWRRISSQTSLRHLADVLIKSS
ncbi:unnamed protein product [Pleuronectes platessa]|uniref:Uncharacterized protein n=1 Tax=Pleuronectes platessa TaxID=8262 RepID=A0A9N7Y062_PLEPL|nr:unnamed protein product [Pleuronectes platessa]